MASVEGTYKAMAEAHDVVAHAINKVYSGDPEKQAFAMFIVDEYEYSLRHILELNNDDGSTKKSDA